MLLIALLFVGACKGREEGEGNAAAPAPGGEARTAQAGGGGKGGGGGAAGAPTSLTGLWESGAGARKNQLCMTEDGGKAEFGLITYAAGGNNCSGAGEAARSGQRLVLTMTGDRTCRIEATLAGGTIALPASLPEGCDYYCAPGARLAGARFERSGSTRADAMKAKDFADDPLCG
jgi:hypothetical protein